ncbi:MAG TPA: adenylate/guanylate cyclase domain-containing protein, partial [Candidatus Bathyarchaeia archaeon]|nr:adenylate/guanylate cyclase domain-containing protein [Candidatus Bathyarchaeia archaeon]
TALGQKNESLSLELVGEQRRKIRPLLKDHHGREVKTMGDSFLVEFPSALDAVRCAYSIQKAIRESNASVPEERRVHLRIGVHLGDVVESKGDISGDAVNVASRIEPLAEDGGVCMSRQVYDHVQNKFDLSIVTVGAKTLKNVSTPVEVFKILMPWEAEKPASSIHLDSKRIAILPFANMSPDPGDSYFADGITEELISTISNISGLQVISRTSVMGYKGANKRIPEIGQELKVGSVLEGSVRKADSLVRVTAQLIDVNSDQHLWSQSYDRELKNIFALQSEISKHVAESLRVKILSPETVQLDRKPTENTEAYSLYLKGRSHWNKRGIDDVKKAMQYFELAVQEDPGFALGYVGQADCCVILRDNWALDREANREKAKVKIARALKLDPGLAEAHATNAMVLTQEYRMRLAEEEFRKSIELKPNYGTAHHWYSTLLLSLERWDEALGEIRKALELDPLSPVITLNLGFYYMAKREYPKSAEPFKRAVEMGFAPAHMFLGFAYGQMKMFSEMKREFGIFADHVRDIYPFVEKSMEAFIAEDEDDTQTLRSLLPFLEAHIGETLSDSYQIAGYYFRLGDIDKGFEWLEKSYSRREGSIVRIKIDWNMDGIRDDPRYHEMIKRLEMD